MSRSSKHCGMGAISGCAGVGLILPELAKFRPRRTGQHNCHREAERDVDGLQYLQHVALNLAQLNRTNGITPVHGSLEYNRRPFLREGNWRPEPRAVARVLVFA